MAGTVLLADDSITIQKVVELTFAETEHRVVAVGSGRDLFNRLPEVKPDVVLCDVVMPDMNGYEVCQTLKSDPATLHIPVVLLTGTFEPFDRDRALAAGCDAIVTKPFEARDLINVVEDLIKRAQAVAAAPAPTESADLGDLGIPEGVQSLDYSTTGFDRMVPPPPVEAAPPEDGIELTASALGDSSPQVAAVVPPELQENAEGAPAAFDFAGEPPAVAPTPEPSPTPSVGTAPSFETAPESASAGATMSEVPPTPSAATGAERFPVAKDEPGFPVETPAEAGPFGPVAPFAFAAEAVTPPTEEGTPPAPSTTKAGAADGDALVTALGPFPDPKEAMAEPTLAATGGGAVPEATPQSGAGAEPQSAAGGTSGVAASLSAEELDRVVKAVLAALPAQGEAAGTVPELGDRQLERVARMVLELASERIERIAWEVIPDMAEMLVRKRIADLEKAAAEEN